jgi:hypothetical protein
VIIFEKEGYKPLTMPLATKMDGMFWGNIVLGGFLGSTTDSATGAMYEYSPSQYMVTLQSASASLDANNQRTQAERVKEFIVLGYTNLQSDLKNGSGQYLSSLLELLNVPTDNHAKAIKTIQTLGNVYPNIMEFANQVNNFFPEKK